MTRLIVRLHKRAEAEIRETAAWYHVRGENLGVRFLGAVRTALEQLESQTARFSKLESIPGDLAIYRARVKDFPYLVIFEVFEKEVFVYAVAHASREPNYWRRRKRPKQ